ncbi:hypothetical protein [Paraburkholderia sp. J67]|uniref:hypothetical protein n=1 Tax=Paraburkholderia sp. J67 TaxID=2805435 RepID=UPI002ABD2A3B|nr:hypothetical protein [Paraburkholderia sp. J67]
MKTHLSINPLKPVWRLTDKERDDLLEVFLRITASPYRNLDRFVQEVQQDDPVMRAFSETVIRLRQQANLAQNPVLYIKNLPIDPDLPVFGHDDPVRDKYAMKTTFVTEALLELFASAANTPIVGYRTINNGDMFHDVYLKESLKNTASQKSMVSFGFHYDMGFKKVRPDWANLACLRSSAENYVSTSVCRNIDILAELSPSDLAMLSFPIYSTPPEVVSLVGGETNKSSPLKPVYFPDKPWKFEYFEGRTVTDDANGSAAISRLNEILHRTKRHLVLEPGDLAVVSNNHAIHCREVLDITDMNAHRIRWLIKTYNVDNLSVHRANLVVGQFRIADE